ncbi:unnamed protein product [Penicillium olsonii]|nr:unnamed protein product [Penicillium olsonii]
MRPPRPATVASGRFARNALGSNRRVPHFPPPLSFTNALQSRSPFNMPKEKSTRKAPEKRQARRKKDPNAPKRGLSAYMFFANDNRDKVREENPGISFGQVGKQLGDKWKALSEDDRKPYDDKAAKDKKRYEEEKAAYLAKGDDEEEEESS